MSILGFPSEADITSMMGYVTAEDRENWNRMKEASDRQLEEARNGLTARSLASQSVVPAFGLAEKSINAQMHGEQMVERDAMRKSRKERVEIKETRTRFREEDVPDVADDREMGY